MYNSVTCANWRFKSAKISYWFLGNEASAMQELEKSCTTPSFCFSCTLPLKQNEGVLGCVTVKYFLHSECVWTINPTVYMFDFLSFLTSSSPAELSVDGHFDETNSKPKSNQCPWSSLKSQWLVRDWPCGLVCPYDNATGTEGERTLTLQG